MSVLPILPFAPSGRNNALINYADLLEEPCLECPMSSSECSEPLCSPFSALTTQCTNQCVVIACNDPDHAESPVCDKQVWNSQCDDILDCTDCVGFEDLLQCCENYAALHPVPSQSQRALEPHQAFSWRPPFSCLWGSCDASFASSTELINHVNLNHLVTSTPSNFHNLPPAHDHQFEQIKLPMTCKWGDCTSQPVSSFNDADLACHLLREHLGVTSPPSGPLEQATQSTTSQTLLFDTTFGQDTPSQSNLNDNTQGQTTRLRATPPQSTSHAHEDDPHSCSGVHECKWQECGLFFPTCQELTAHITAIHIGSGQAQYGCFWDQCTRNGSNGFQSKQKICRHVQSHTGHRPFQCTICQQFFSEAATLQQHIRRHTQEKPYVCDHPGCEKSFAITGALTIHKRTHNGDKPFKCLYCERGFAESSNLSKHLRTHTGARRYVCTDFNCGKTFARPDHLNRHKSVHKRQHRGVGSGE